MLLLTYAPDAEIIYEILSCCFVPAGLCGFLMDYLAWSQTLVKVAWHVL